MDYYEQLAARPSYEDSLKVLEADIQHANMLWVNPFSFSFPLIWFLLFRFDLKLGLWNEKHSDGFLNCIICDVILFCILHLLFWVWNPTLHYPKGSTWPWGSISLLNWFCFWWVGFCFSIFKVYYFEAEWAERDGESLFVCYFFSTQISFCYGCEERVYFQTPEKKEWRRVYLNSWSLFVSTFIGMLFEFQYVDPIQSFNLSVYDLLYLILDILLASTESLAASCP